MDHAALQWARTFENANRRLAAWGLVFSAFPGMEIVHRAGRLHSNVDPLSRLPRDPGSQRTRGAPDHVSPAKDLTPAIVTDTDAAELRRNRIAKRAAQEIQDGFYVNLGVGIPTLVPEHLKPGVSVWWQSENGILGMGPYPTEKQLDAYGWPHTNFGTID